MKLFNEKGRSFKLAALAAVFSLLAALVYLIYTLAVGLFTPSVFIMTLLGAAGFALVALTKWDFALLVPAVLAGIGFGLHLFDRVEMFAYMATGVYGMGEKGAILWIVLLIMALQLAAVVLGCISCFCWRTPEEENAAKAVSFGKRSKAVPIVAAVAVLAILAAGAAVVTNNLNGPSAAGEVTLTGIEVTTLPSKTEYSIEDFFSTDGMVVTAKYSDGTAAPITGYDFAPKNALTEADTQAVVTYMGFETAVPIQVHEIVAVELSGNEIKAQLMEHGAAYIETASGRKTGTWGNSGRNIFVTLEETRYDAAESDGTYMLDLDVDGTQYTLTGKLNGELFLGGTFNGTSAAGDVVIVLNEDGTLGGQFIVPAEGTWSRQGMQLVMDVNYAMLGTQQQNTAEKVNGVYTATFGPLLEYRLTSDCTFTPNK